MRSLILSQCRDLRISVIREDLGALTTIYVQDSSEGLTPENSDALTNCALYTHSFRVGLGPNESEIHTVRSLKLGNYRELECDRILETSRLIKYHTVMSLVY